MTEAPLSPEPSEPAVDSRSDPGPRPSGAPPIPTPRGTSSGQETCLEFAEATPTVVSDEPRDLINGWPDPGWNRYRCVKLQGAGGMGRVFKAWDPRLKRHVAIKLLQGDDPGQTARFVREARAQARIEHPNICKVYEVGEVAGRPFIAMQFIDGPTIGQAAPRLTREQKALCLKQVAEALHAAHRAGLIHRDIKPANIMLEGAEDGSWQPYIVDFGLVRETGGDLLTLSGATLGTPSYMSPEQASGKISQLDRRSDIYGLGATLYTLLAGRAPFEGDNPVEIILKLLRDDPMPLRRLEPGVPADLETIVMKCLEKEPSQRYDSARELAEDLGRFLDGESIMARPAGLPLRLLKKARKHKAMVSLGTIFLAVTLVLLGLWWRTSWESGRRVELAQRFSQKVEQLESLLWKDRSLPLHDVSPTTQRVRQRLRDIEAEMRQLGPLAEGAGNSALGRGYVSLYEYETARPYLESAWKGGNRSPEVAYALGLTLGWLYHQELLALNRVDSPDQRKTMRQRAEKEYRDPALGYLRSSAGHDAADPALVEGLIALYEKRPAEAVQKARIAKARAPWLYEAMILEGDALKAQYRPAFIAGRAEESLQYFRQADTAYQQACRVAESNSAAYMRRATLWHDYLNLMVWFKDQWDPAALDQMLAATRSALEADPDSVKARDLLANMRIDQAEYQLRRGEDPAPAIDAALAAVEEILGKRPDDLQALAVRATVLWTRGKSLMMQGKDAKPTLAAAGREIARALAVAPNDAYLAGTAGNIYLELANVAQGQGIDPEPHLRKAIHNYETQKRSYPRDASIYVNLGMCYEVETLYHFDQESAKIEQSAARGMEVVNQAIQISPGFFISHRVRGVIEEHLGRYLALTGRDSSQLMESALQSYRQAWALNPQDTTTCWRMSETLIVLARLYVDRGRDPDELLTEHRRLTVELEKLIPNPVYHEQLAMAVKFFEVHRLEQNGRSQLKLLGELERQLTRPGTDQAGSLLNLAEVHLQAARWLSEHGADSSAHVRAGLTALERLPAAQANRIEALGFRGRLLLYGARSGRPTGQRAEMAREAVVVFKRLIGRHPSLETVYGKMLSEARARVG